MNLDKETIVGALIDEARLNLKQTQDWLDTRCVDIQCNTFKIDNALVYHILSKIFTDMSAYE